MAKEAKALKEKQEAFQRVIEEQKDLRRRCEVSEREKQVACEKALEACEEILLEQAAMKEEYERAQKEKGKGFGKVMKAYENALKDISDLQERCKRLEIAKEEACDNAAQGESHLRAKEEAFKIALDEASRKHQKGPEVWYVGLGSMMNKTTLALHQICPSVSLVCHLPGLDIKARTGTA